MSMDIYYRKVSKDLCEVLDYIGASEDVRKLFWETSTAWEIEKNVTNLYFGFKISFYQFGSSCEGTTTLGLQSDLDILQSLDRVHVIDNINDATDGECYLMDCNTKPGYVHLQILSDGIPQCKSLRSVVPGMEEYDDYDKICLTHLSWLAPDSLTRNGPAVTMPMRIYNGCDLVFAYRCRMVPTAANSWIHRTRQYGWPSHKQIQRMKSFGCFLVGVAHPKSNNTKSIEWRISFSLQERELMSGLNPTQHKCYILLKMIKKDLIEPKTDKSISSYHCKTCLFYTIETAESIIWTPENLILCTRKCLERLLDWSKNGNCPNYFIPEENMFDRLDKPTLEKVITALTSILSKGIAFLFSLVCDNIGQLIQTSPNVMPDNRRKANNKIEFEQKMRLVHSNELLTNVYNRYMDFVFSNYMIRYECLQEIHRETTESLPTLQRLLTHLQEINHVTGYSTIDVRKAMSYIIPHIHFHISQCMASVETRRRGNYTSNLLPLEIIMNIMKCSSSSRITVQLSLATCYLQFGMLEACAQLLLEVATIFKPHVVTVCMCYKRSTLSAGTALQNPTVTGIKNVKTEQFIEKYTSGCMVFLQSQANIVHPALQYEMYRSVYTPAGSRDEENDFWFDWVVVDPKVYLYFLQYIFCIKKNTAGHRRRIMETFRHIIKEEKSCFHIETAYNLLGWMLIQENQTIEAWQFLCRSWTNKSFHNAAKWHIVLLLNDLFRKTMSN